jgi:glutaconate CoA-transferase subunit A
MAGYYDMDWRFYAYYERETRTEEGFEKFLEKWVYGVRDREEYLRLIDSKRLESLIPEPFTSSAVSYGKLTRHFEV